MLKKPMNVQDVFLNFSRKESVPVTIFLVNGIKLFGVVCAFDNFSVLLERETHIQLIYKHAISTIVPQSIVNIDKLFVHPHGEECSENISKVPSNNYA
ncbi:MAG: RNA chaperone Hfq [Holosporales bacterium]|jgi:host factor-I protein|nr:RNA chaperone Hfq [Holosporales bacterium]